MELGKLLSGKDASTSNTSFDILRKVYHENTHRITKGIEYALKSGNWQIKRFRIDRSGVSQVLSRFSYMIALGSMTKVKSNFQKSGKLSGPRALQGSQWGMLCP